MKKKIDPRIPRQTELVLPTFIALKELGGSGKNDEILNRVIEDLKLSNEVVDIPHPGKNMTELEYQLAWARTRLSNSDVIENSARAVWSIRPDYMSVEELDVKSINANASSIKNKKNSASKKEEELEEDSDDEAEYPDEIKPWRTRLSDILQNMDPYGFERLAQRILRESGFEDVNVTQKSGDGGIDGTGKLKISGIFSFNVAFQCKRYSGLVGTGAIRDFRGSLAAYIEKAVMITTGSFSKAAIEEASDPGKQQIDLIDGEALINKIIEYGIGVKEVKSYEIDEDFFRKI